MASNAGSHLTALQQQIFRLETELLNEKNASETLKKKNDELIKALGDSHLDSMNDTISLPDDVLKEMSEKDETIKSLQKNLSDLSKKFVDLKREVEESADRPDKPLGDTPTLPELYEQLEEWQAAFFDQENTLKDCIEELATLSEQVYSVEKAKAGSEEALKSLQDAHENLDEKYAELEDSYAELLTFKENYQNAQVANDPKLDGLVIELRQNLAKAQQELQDSNVDLMKEQEERSSLESELSESCEAMTELKNSQLELQEKLNQIEEATEKQREELIEKRREKEQLGQTLSDANRLRGNLESSLNTLNAEYEELKKDHRETSRGFSLGKSVFAVVVSLIILGILMGFAFKSLMMKDLVENSSNIKKINIRQIDSSLFSAFHFDSHERLSLKIRARNKLSDRSLNQDLRVLMMNLKRLNGRLELQIIYPVKTGDSIAPKKALRLYRSFKNLLKTATVTLELKESSQEDLALLVRLYEETENE